MEVHDRLFILADGSKRVELLNSGDVPVPIAVVPFAWSAVSRRLEDLGASWQLREARAKDGPVVTDNGNLILDAWFVTGEGPGIVNPRTLERELAAIPGVVESGLFCDCVNSLYCGTQDGVDVLRQGGG